MASLIYDGSVSQTTTYAGTDIYTLAIPTSSITNISQQGGNVVFQTGATSLTLVGVTLAQLIPANFALQGGGIVRFGDSTAQTIADQFGNTLEGTANADILVGLGGGDTITAGNGNNFIIGGVATTDANDGADSITSGTGNDTIYGNAGADTISSGGGADVVFGGLGADVITTGALTGNASVFGGGSFTDTTDGADSIVVAGSTGSLFVTGNAGNDTISVGGTTPITGSSSVFGGIGADLIGVTASGGNHLIAGGSSAGSTDVDTITFQGTGTANVTVFGGTGVNDANDGRDVINVSVAGGTAEIYGNAGDDAINLETNGVASVYGGVGSDAIAVSGPALGGGVASAARVQIFGGPNGTAAETITVTLAAGAATTVFGGVGINDAADGADTIVTGASNDLIYGNGGNDTISAGAGNNTVFGGAGNDLFIANDATTRTTEAAQTTLIADYTAGQDTLLLQSGVLGTATSVNATSSAIAFSGATQNTLAVTGTLSAANSTVFTGRIDNGATAGAVDTTDGLVLVNTSTTGTTLTGSANSDFIFGNTGADSIVAGAGDDVIRGGAGRDLIDVGAGTDRVIQGLGDSGTFTLPAANTISTATFDIVSNAANGDLIDLTDANRTLVAGTTNVSAAANEVANNEYVFVRGNYDAAAQTFVGAADGASTLLVYDADAGAGVAREAIVLVGFVGQTGGDDANGVITLASA